MLNNKRHIYFLLFFLLFSIVSCDKIAKQRARHYFEKGKKLYESGEYMKAVGEFNNALVFDPTFFDALYWQGMAYYRHGAFAEAFKRFTSALIQKPDDLPLCFLSVDAAIKCRKFGLASGAIQAILKKDKDNKEALFLQIYCQIRTELPGSVDFAIKALKDLMAKQTNDPRIYCLHAQIKIKQGFLAQAETLVTEHYTSHPVWLETMKLLAEAYVKNSDFSKAKETYKKMLSRVDEIESKYLIQSEFVAFLMKINQPEFAEGVLRDMVKEHPDATGDKINLFNCLIALKKFSEAEKLINIEIRNNPDVFEFKEMLISLSRKKDDMEKTIAIVKNILSSLEKNCPQYNELKNIIADIYFFNGKLEDSQAYSQEVLAVDPKNAQAQFNLCRITLQKNSGLAVVGELRRLSNENPGNAEYSYYLGLAHKARGEDILAQTAFEDALEKSPEHKNALIALSEMYAKIGIYKKLEKYVGKYLKLNPDDEEVKSLLQRAKQRPSSVDNNTEN